jgi:hypothetical protein
VKTNGANPQTTVVVIPITGVGAMVTTMEKIALLPQRAEVGVTK